MSLLRCLFAFIFVMYTLSVPQLTNISQKNQCIKSLVTTFVTGDTCQSLTQNKKSELAFRMTNCLFVQMGKKQIKCQSKQNCQLQGDSWNSFTTFFAHIDNLCHFYWDISKAQRTSQMIDALLQSAQNTEQILQKNSENTKQILQLQQSLKLQILTSMASQQQMSQIITNSSHALTNLASHLSSSLNKIHEDIDQHYAIITRILSAINQVISHLDSLQMYLVAQATSLQGIMFFIALVILILIGCIISNRIRRIKNQCFIIVSLHFILEYFFSTYIQALVGIRSMRCISIMIMIVLAVLIKQPRNQIERQLEKHLNSQKMSRLMQKAIQRQMYHGVQNRIIVKPQIKATPRTS